MPLVGTMVLGLLVALPPPLCRGRVFNKYDPREDRSPTQRATAEVRAAYQSLCPENDCGSGVLYENPTIGNNAVTWVSGIRDGPSTRAKIVYSANFLNGLAAAFGDGASFGVLAHEVGHHLTAARSLRGRFDSSWDEELRADYLAGCALGRTGRSPDELENALRALAATQTPTHPSFANRNPVVRRGYRECGPEQDQIDKKREDRGFGIGKMIKRRSRKLGCWSYWYRDPEQVNKVGPVAAQRRRSRSYSDRDSCQEGRAKMLEVTATVAEQCECYE